MTPTEWEIFANDIYDKELSKNSYNVFKKSNLKMGRGPQYPFFQRRHSDGQQMHEKMLCILQIIRGMQVKTSIRYQFTPVRTAVMGGS